MQVKSNTERVFILENCSIYVAFLSVLVGVAAVRDDVEAEKQLLVKILMHFFTHEGVDMQVRQIWMDEFQCYPKPFHSFTAKWSIK